MARHRGARRAAGAGRRLLRLLAWASLAACAAAPPPPSSLWPPADYYVEVRYSEGGKDRQRARFWGSGLVVYGEATGWLGGPEQGTAMLPVFGRLCAYRMREKSIRHLSRLLERAGLKELAGVQGAADEAAPMLTLQWRSFEHPPLTAVLVGRAEGAAVPVLQVIHAFLPAGCAFDLDGLSAGDPEPPHLVEVPEPVESVEGALRFYREALLDEFPAMADLAVEAFALAVAAGALDEAGRLLERVRAAPDGPREDWWVLPTGERPSLDLQLELLLERARRGQPVTARLGRPLRSPSSGATAGAGRARSRRAAA